MMNELVTLFRPVGVKELELIEQSEMRAFPPRLQWQPIFYPVLNEQYACEICEKWNVNDEASGYAGFVTAFDVPKEYFEQFEVQNVGSHHHNELWVPAEELNAFNEQIQGNIRIIKAFYGIQYKDNKRY